MGQLPCGTPLLPPFLISLSPAQKSSKVTIPINRHLIPLAPVQSDPTSPPHKNEPSPACSFMHTSKGKKQGERWGAYMYVWEKPDDRIRGIRGFRRKIRGGTNEPYGSKCTCTSCTGLPFPQGGGRGHSCKWRGKGKGKKGGKEKFSAAIR